MLLVPPLPRLPGGCTLCFGLPVTFLGSFSLTLFISSTKWCFLFFVLFFLFQLVLFKCLPHPLREGKTFFFVLFSSFFLLFLFRLLLCSLFFLVFFRSSISQNAYVVRVLSCMITLHVQTHYLCVYFFFVQRNNAVTAVSLGRSFVTT